MCTRVKCVDSSEVMAPPSAKTLVFAVCIAKHKGVITQDPSEVVGAFYACYVHHRYFRLQPRAKT